MKPDPQKTKPLIRLVYGQWWVDCGPNAARGFTGSFREACGLAKAMWERQ